MRELIQRLDEAMRGSAKTPESTTESQARAYRKALAAVLLTLPSSAGNARIQGMADDLLGLEHFLEEHIGFDEGGTPLYIDLASFGDENTGLRARVVAMIKKLDELL